MIGFAPIDYIVKIQGKKIHKMIVGFASIDWSLPNFPIL